MSCSSAARWWTPRLAASTPAGGDYPLHLHMVQYPHHTHRWHGEVVIHSYRPRDDAEVCVGVQCPVLRVSRRQVRAWLATVRSLAHIRHENVLLYMGAAVDPPRFAIVTCPVKVTHLAGDITLVIILPGTIPGVCSQPRPRTQLQHQGDVSPIISSYHQNNILSGVHPDPDGPRPLLPARQGDRAREAVSSQHLPGDQGAALQAPASHSSCLTLCAGEGVSAGLRPRPPQHAVHRPRAGGGGGGGGHQGRGLNSAQCEYCGPMFEMRGG